MMFLSRSLGYAFSCPDGLYDLMDVTPAILLPLLDCSDMFLPAIRDGSECDPLANGSHDPGDRYRAYLTPMTAIQI